MRRRSQSANTPVTIRITIRSKPSPRMIDDALNALRSTCSFASRNAIAGCSRNWTRRTIAATKIRNRQPWRRPSGPMKIDLNLLIGPRGGRRERQGELHQANQHAPGLLGPNHVSGVLKPNPSFAGRLQPVEPALHWLRRCSVVVTTSEDEHGTAEARQPCEIGGCHFWQKLGQRERAAGVDCLEVSLRVIRRNFLGVFPKVIALTPVSQPTVTYRPLSLYVYLFERQRAIWLRIRCDGFKFLHRLSVPGLSRSV